MEVLVIIVLLFIIMYSMLILRWLVAWLMRPSQVSVPEHMQSHLEATVIVAVRNEEHNIVQLLKCLENQDCKNLEVIVSDDFSDDNTSGVVKDFINKNIQNKIVYKFISGNEGDSFGKKAALERAINISSSDVIITTDADCKVEKRWVSTFLSHFHQSDVKMVIGAVKYSPAGTLLGKLQALDIAGLSVSSATSLLTGKPLMCNGANLAFLRSAFIENGGYVYGANDYSGDDTYLMLSLFKKNSNTVKFNFYPGSIVSTKPVIRFIDLINQRVRWASKIGNYKENYIRNTGLFLFSVNCLLLTLPVLSLFDMVSWVFTFSVWIIKIVADLLLLFPFLTFTHQRSLLLLFLPLEFIYPFYSVIGGVLSIFKMKYNWKGRIAG